MRMRNVKNKEQIINDCPFCLTSYKENKGKWHEVFNNNNPIYIEIGMGKGKFIYENALKYKDINFIGIEKFDNILAKALPKMDHLDNLYILRMDAEEINEVFSKEIDKIYLNFSDPWPKDRHQKRRLTSPLFLEKYEEIFKNDKIIEMKTDNQSLFIYSIESLSTMGYSLSEVSFDYHKDYQNIIMTEYEIKFSSKGDKIYHLFAQKSFKN